MYVHNTVTNDVFVGNNKIHHHFALYLSLITATLVGLNYMLHVCANIINIVVFVLKYDIRSDLAFSSNGQPIEENKPAPLSHTKTFEGFSTWTFGLAESSHSKLICFSITSFIAPIWAELPAETDLLLNGAKARPPCLQASCSDVTQLLSTPDDQLSVIL